MMRPTSETAQQTPPYISQSDCCKKAILVTIEIFLGSGVIVLGLYFAHMHGVGTGALIGIGGAGSLGVLTIVTLTLSGLRKKPSQDLYLESESGEESKPESVPSIGDTLARFLHPKGPIKGKIALFEGLTASALGKDLTLMFPDTKKIQRKDLKEWKDNPHEMLLEFRVFNLEKVFNLGNKHSLLQEGKIFLPFCLFTHNDDYTDWKKEGETVEFIYDGQLYELTIDHLESPLKHPFETLIPKCEDQYYAKQGRNLFPKLCVDGKLEGDFTSYISAIDLKRHAEALKNMEARKKAFAQDFPKEAASLDLKYPFEPISHPIQKGLVVELCGVKKSNIQIVYSDKSFAIVGKKELSEEEEKNLKNISFRGIWVDVADYPELNPKEWLFFRNYDSTLTRENIEKGKKVSKDGLLYIIFPDFLPLETHEARVAPSQPALSVLNPSFP